MVYSQDVDIAGGTTPFGAISDLSDLGGSALIKAKATSIFKCAGNDGAGDPGGYPNDDPATTKTIDVANTIQSSLGFDTPVLPILISYTCNLSLGNMKGQLDNASNHEHSFAT